MKHIILFTYRAIVVPIGVLLCLTLGVLFVPKIRAGLRMRRERRSWPTFPQPPLWIHASSGEFEYAKPFIREVKSRHPNRPVVVTYFSPSYAAAIARFPGVDFSLPLPIDLPGPTRSFLAKLKPEAGFLARTDLWPELLHQAQTLKIPLILFSATKTKAPRLAVGLFYRWLYSYLRAIFCVTDSDARNIHKIAPTVSTVVIGDTRFDQVLERLRSPKQLREVLRPDRSRTLVAGSTWPEDEAVLLEALTEKLKAGELKLILAPHEPTESHIHDLQNLLQKKGLHADLYSLSHRFDGEVLIVDQIGILAELYQWGSLALVGGSFKGSVHSVMEPLAAGCLTVVGPYHHNNREALEFQKLTVSGTAIVQVAHDAVELATVIDANQEAWNPTISVQIQAEIENRCGASARLADFFETVAST